MKRTVAAFAAGALAAISLSIPASVLTTAAFASKMNGKCCASSDGGRSHLHMIAKGRIGLPRTCSAYAASCIRESADKPDRVQLCQTAKAQCLRTGVHVGPYSGYHYARIEKR
jgi:hypothetical protein